MIEITSDEVVGVSQLIRNFSGYLNKLKERKVSKLLLSRQSGLEAVLLSVKDYERLLDVQGQFDHFIVSQELRYREKNDRGKRISREQLKRKYALED